MKKFLFLGLTLSLLSSCSNDKDLITTNQDSLFSLTSENALKICGGKSRILENKNEEIITLVNLSVCLMSITMEFAKITNARTIIGISNIL